MKARVPEVVGRSRHGHLVPRHVIIGVAMGGCNSDVPVPHLPHEYPSPSAFGRLAWGVDGMIAARQPLHNRVLKETQFERVLVGADA
jgi:hypothetical protein